MDPNNYCIPGGSGQLSRCGACDDGERGCCRYYFPAGAWSNGCMHHRDDIDGHCDNVAAQDAARNGGQP